MITNREKKLIKATLLQKDGYISCRKLAKLLNVSEKTVRNEINNINAQIKNYGAEIFSKSGAGNGYFLSVSNEAKFMQYVNIMPENKEYSQPDVRIQYMAILILNSNGYITTSKIADRLYISKEQAAKDLKKIKILFSEKGVQLVSKPRLGLRCEGDELSKRILIAQAIQKHEELADIFYKYDVSSAVKIIKIFFIENEINITELVVNSLVLQICVIIQRLIDGFHLEQNDEMLKLQKEYASYRDAEYLAVVLSKKFHVEINFYEIGQISALIEGNRITDDIPQAMKGLFVEVDHLLNLIYRKYTIDLRNDNQLKADLGMHLYRMFLKLDYDSQYDYEIDEATIYQFPLASELAYYSVRHLMPNKNDTFTHNEEALITLHFELAIRRLAEKQSDVLMVLDTVSRGSIEFIDYEFRTYFAAYIKSITIVPSYKLPSIDKNKYDHVFYMSDEHAKNGLAPLSTNGRKMITAQLRNSALTEDKFSKVMDHTHLLWIIKITPDDFEKDFLKQVVKIDKEFMHCPDKLLAEEIHSVKCTPNISYAVHMSEEKDSRFYIAIKKKENLKNRISMFILLLQGRNGIIQDLPLYYCIARIITVFIKGNETQIRDFESIKKLMINTY